MIKYIRKVNKKNNKLISGIKFRVDQNPTKKISKYKILIIKVDIKWDFVIISRLWWRCFLSGKKGFFLSNNLKITTLPILNKG